MKRSVFMVLTLTIVGVSIFANAATPVAIVNGEKVNSDFLNLMADLKRILSSVYTIDEKFFNVLTSTEEGLLFLQRYRYEVLKDIVDQALVQQMAKKDGVYPSEEEVKTFVDTQMKNALNNLGMNEKDFEKYIAEFGLTLDDLKKKFSWIYATNKSLENLKEKVTQDATVTKEEIENYYKENYLSKKDQVQKEVYIIVLDNKDSSTEALRRILKGENFEDVAKEMSVDSETAKDGGKIGFLTEDKMKYLLGDDIAKKIMNSPKDAILGPYKAGVKWVIIKVGDSKKEKIPSFEEVREEIVEKLLEKKKEEIWNKWWNTEFKKFKESSEIKILMYQPAKENEQQ
ncbi:MAG: peptidyl-prolyl cis-trans isomerase [Thermotogaceae bacterium]|nr:peptidyl-prolyl cis-trans isomerase [Thermotogaceae bacterium]